MCTHVMNHWQQCHHKVYLYTDTCAAARRRGGRDASGRVLCMRGDTSRATAQYGDRYMPDWMRGCRHDVKKVPVEGLPGACEDCTRISDFDYSLDADIAGGFE
ncbi:hypothetical protein E8E14_007777 [Neopestalotiopsis sp. 37M]|nr:hypothetical protein E8E14_007777 [Neopestalotiopsis sp. 37M]